MINNQHNNSDKKFVPKGNDSVGHNDSNAGAHATSRSFSAAATSAGTKSFVAEHLNKPEASSKNLVFVRKGQSHSHSNQNNAHRNAPKKHNVRKVTSEFA